MNEKKEGSAGWRGSNSKWLELACGGVFFGWVNF
jgi:hypothetical protein